MSRNIPLENRLVILAFPKEKMEEFLTAYNSGSGAFWEDASRVKKVLSTIQNVVCFDYTTMKIGIDYDPTGLCCDWICAGFGHTDPRITDPEQTDRRIDMRGTLCFLDLWDAFAIIDAFGNLLLTVDMDKEGITYSHMDHTLISTKCMEMINNAVRVRDNTGTTEPEEIVF